MLSAQRPGPGRRGRMRFLLAGLLLAGVAAALLVPFLLVSARMGTNQAPATVRQFALASPGARITLVLEVTALPSGALLTGTLLRQDGGAAYARTGQGVTVRWDTAQLVMGRSSDIRRGAVLQVSGRLDGGGALVASQMVVLSGVVQVHG